MEDEISSIAAIIGASWTGKKVMTATSGPGISLMLENIGFAIGVETPCVIVNVQRGAPYNRNAHRRRRSEIWSRPNGVLTEIMRSSLSVRPLRRRCSTIPFWLSTMPKNIRTPVFVLSDAFVGHMREEVVIPGAGED